KDGWSAIQQSLDDVAAVPFDLTRGPLVRLSVCRTSPDDCIVLIVMHHIVSDGWSGGILLRELTTLYEAFSRGEPSPLPELAIQYADFAAWHRKWLEDGVLGAELAYWREQLRGAPRGIALPAHHDDSDDAGPRGAQVQFDLDAEETQSAVD